MSQVTIKKCLFNNVLSFVCSRFTTHISINNYESKVHIDDEIIVGWLKLAFVKFLKSCENSHKHNKWCSFAYVGRLSYV